MNERRAVSREVKVMETLKFSPKIVTFVDAFEDDESFYIVQEWCRGGSVQQYVQTHPLYGENTVASIMRGALRGLIHMHENNIVHRDIKSGNIMLGDASEDANVKLGDFGTSMFLPRGSETLAVDELVGTVWFMSPESLSHTYVKASDVWSIGVLAYQLLTGVMPFDDLSNPVAPNVLAVCRAILETEPKMTGSRWNGISDDAKSFVSMCLKKDHSRRPTAYECLMHPWLTQTDCSDRFKGVPLSSTPFVYDENAKKIYVNNKFDG
jgi:serine/threonine protein kinase